MPEKLLFMTLSLLVKYLYIIYFFSIVYRMRDAKTSQKLSPTSLYDEANFVHGSSIFSGPLNVLFKWNGRRVLASKRALLSIALSRSSQLHINLELYCGEELFRRPSWLAMLLSTIVQRFYLEVKPIFRWSNRRIVPWSGGGGIPMDRIERVVIWMEFSTRLMFVEFDLVFFFVIFNNVLVKRMRSVCRKLKILVYLIHWFFGVVSYISWNPLAKGQIPATTASQAANNGSCMSIFSISSSTVGGFVFYNWFCGFPIDSQKSRTNLHRDAL